ncbi:GTPase IMAP family member 9-like [Acanthopagrus schlegelii]
MATADTGDLTPLEQSSSCGLLPPHTSELRVVLLGNSWSQRSSVGNFILGKYMFNTKEEPGGCLRVSGRVKEKHIVLINTPNLLHPNMSDNKLTEHVETCVGYSKPGPHVFLLVLQPEDFTEEQKQRLLKILGKFSDESFDHSLVLISTPREERPGLMEKVSESPPLKDMMKKCKHKHLKQKNLEPSVLLGHLDEIVKEHNGDHVSCDVFKDTISSSPAEQQSHEQKEKQTALMDSVKAAASGIRIVLLGKTEDDQTSLGNFIIGEQALYQKTKMCSVR